jgi:Protein of unknown function (DUF5132)
MSPVLPGAVLVLVGVGLGAAGKNLLRAAAPRVGRASRPIVRATIRQGLLLSREVRQVADSVREDLEDVAAEAVLDADSKGASRNGSKKKPGA